MPAHAELVLEGEMVEGVTAKEGPFGEFTGYYASSPSEQPVVNVRRVYWRNDPIISIASPMRPPSDFSFSKCVMKAGMIWDEVEHAGLAGVTGVRAGADRCSARLLLAPQLDRAQCSPDKAQAAHRLRGAGQREDR